MNLTGQIRHLALAPGKTGKQGIALLAHRHLPAGHIHFLHKFLQHTLRRVRIKIRKHPAAHIIVAGNSAQRLNGPAGLHAVVHLGKGPFGNHHGHGAVAHDQIGGIFHLPGRNPRQLFHPLGREIVDIGAVFKKPLHMLFQIGAVDPSLFHKDVGQAVGQGRIRPRPGAQVQIRQAVCAHGDARVNGDDLGPPFLGERRVDHRVALIIEVAAPHQHHAGVLNIRPAGAARRHAGGNGCTAVLQAPGRIAVVHTAERARQALNCRAVPLVVAAGEHHCAGIVFLFALPQALADFLQRLLPGDGLEGSAAALPRAAQRRFNPVGVVDIGPVGIAPGAQIAVAISRVFAPGHLDDAAILRIGVDIAARRADVAHGSADVNVVLPGRNFRPAIWFFRVHKAPPSVSLVCRPRFSLQNADALPGAFRQECNVHNGFGANLVHADIRLAPGAAVKGAGAVVAQHKDAALRHLKAALRSDSPPPAPRRSHKHSRPPG